MLDAQTRVVMDRYDQAATGGITTETTLTTANVTGASFGKPFSYHVDGAVHAQPLYVGGSLTVSSDAAKSGSGILWATLTAHRSADHGNAAGVIRAYHAETMSELWNSGTDARRDRLGTLVKFVPPLVVAGKVYVPNYDNGLAVYGLLPLVPRQRSAFQVGRRHRPEEMSCERRSVHPASASNRRNC